MGQICLLILFIFFPSPLLLPLLFISLYSWFLVLPSSLSAISEKNQKIWKYLSGFVLTYLGIFLLLQASFGGILLGSWSAWNSLGIFSDPPLLSLGALGICTLIWGCIWATPEAGKIFLIFLNYLLKINSKIFFFFRNYFVFKKKISSIFSSDFNERKRRTKSEGGKK